MEYLSHIWDRSSFACLREFSVKGIRLVSSASLTSKLGPLSLRRTFGCFF